MSIRTLARGCDFCLGFVRSLRSGAWRVVTACRDTPVSCVPDAIARIELRSGWPRRTPAAAARPGRRPPPRGPGVAPSALPRRPDFLRDMRPGTRERPGRVLGAVRELVHRVAVRNPRSGDGGGGRHSTRTPVWARSALHSSLPATTAEKPGKGTRAANPSSGCVPRPTPPALSRERASRQAAPRPACAVRPVSRARGLADGRRAPCCRAARHPTRRGSPTSSEPASRLAARGRASRAGASRGPARRRGRRAGRTPSRRGR